MEFPAFAYYKSTKLILAFITCSVEFLLMFMVAGIILTLFKVSATPRQKALFAFLTGTILQSGYTYGIYFLHGAVSFTAAQFVLITTPNPIVALIYCGLAIKIFHLSPVRSIKVMSYVYLFWSLNKLFDQFLGALIFTQKHGNWNYLLDIFQQMTSLIIFCGIYQFITHLLRQKKLNVAFADNRFFDQKKELLLYFFKALFIYLVSALIPIYMNYTKASSFLALLLNILFFIVVIEVDMLGYYGQVVENSNVHISTLFNGLEAFRGIKQDFYTILQTYSGYLETGKIEQLKAYHNSLVAATTYAGTSMELSRKLKENPAFVSLLTSKLEYANRLNVKLHYSLQCDLSDFYLDNMDMCRMFACLLDNAIESAATSVEKRIYFSAESKTSNSKLLIITNSTETAVDVDDILRHGATSKEGHTGIGLTTVRNIIGKYGNCTFQMKYYNYELSAYFEVQKQ